MNFQCTFPYYNVKMYYVRRIITINALLVLQCTAVVASDTGSGDVVKTVVEGLKTGWKTYTDLFKNLCQQMVGSATEKSGNDAAGLGINVCDNSIAITLLLGIVSAIWGSFQFLCRLVIYIYIFHCNIPIIYIFYY